MKQYKFEIVPLQLLRGASFNKCLVIADEMQVCDHMEILTVGTRIGEGSKLVIMGDLNQRDENIAKEKTGIYKLFNDQVAKKSPLLAAIELQRCERSATAMLFSEIFEE
jgi:predicted ribonuclease YlaK